MTRSRAPNAPSPMYLSCAHRHSFRSTLTQILDKEKGSDFFFV